MLLLAPDARRLAQSVREAACKLGPSRRRPYGEPLVQVILTGCCAAGIKAEAHRLASQGGTLPPDVLLHESRFPRVQVRNAPAAPDYVDDDTTAKYYGEALLQRAGLLLADHVELLSLHCQAAGAAGARFAANHCIASALEENLRGGTREPGLP